MAKNNEIENTKLKEKINLLSNNYKRDSVYFINLNKESISKIKSKLKDSILNHKTLSRIINPNEDKKNINNKNITNQQTTVHSKYISTSKKGKNFVDNANNNSFTNNVTSYSNLEKTTNYSNKYTPKATTYTSKQPTKTSYNTPKATIFRGNTKVTIAKTKPITQKSYITTNTKKSTTISNNSSKIVYGIPALDNAINIKNITNSPIYPGCESNIDEKSKQNCLNTKIASFVYNKFNTDVAKRLKYKGFNEIRVLFVIDKYGKSKAIKTIGRWPNTLSSEAKRVVNLLPKMKPGKINGRNLEVKYSIKVPFFIK